MNIKIQHKMATAVSFNEGLDVSNWHFDMKGFQVFWVVHRLA